jgi:hypothetical protein
MLASWHDEQPEVTPLWICAPLGAGLPNPVPGAVLVAVAGTRAAGTVARWQVSQAVLDGMCEPAPAGLVGGMPTTRAMPANAWLLPAGWWQATQLLLMPLWFISEPEKRAPLTTGRLVIDEPGATWQASQAALVGM